MDCETPSVLVSAFVDGELVGEDREAFERHLDQCGRCRSVLEREQQLMGLVRAAGPLHTPSRRLRATVESLLRPAPRRPALFLLLAPAAAVLLATAVALWTSWPGGRAPTGPAVSELASFGADTHLRQLRGQLPLEVRSDVPRDVAAWFEGRLPFQLELPDYPLGPGERKQHAIVGGRLVSFHGDYAAYVVYRLEERPISLLVTSARAAEPIGGSNVRSGPLTFHVESVAGLKVITWMDRGLTYALVSDLRADGARSCLVCHGTEQERRKLDGLRYPPMS